VNDLYILITLVFIFLFLSIVRPYFRSLSSIEGFLALPALSLLICIGIFPAFGFRPEILPLITFSLILFVASLPRLYDLFRRLKTDDYGEKPIWFVFVSLLFLIIVSSFAYIFSPRANLQLEEHKKPIANEWTRVLTDEKRQVDLFLHIYGPKDLGSETTGRYPLILISAPHSASLDVMDSIIAGLLEHGFMVAAYSRSDLDFPSIRNKEQRGYPSLYIIRKALSAFLAGTSYTFAANDGTELEGERRLDLMYLVNYLQTATENKDEQFRLMDPERLILLGYGTGGAAAVNLAASPDQTNIAAVVSIESILYSSLISNTQPIPENEAGLLGLWGRFVSFINIFHIQPVAGISEVPAPLIPALFICSDRVSETKARDSRYATVLRVLRAAKEASALAFVEGAGLFAYSSIPEAYPMYDAFFQGLSKRRGDSKFYVDTAVGIISNFLSMLEFSKENPDYIQIPIIRSKLSTETHVEAGGTWNSTLAASILRP